MGIKGRPIGSGWMALMAGDWSKANRFVDHYSNLFCTPGSFHADTILKDAKAPYRAFRRDLMDDETSRRGMSFDEFIAAKETLPKSLAAEISTAIAAVSFDCELILAGYIDGEPILLRVYSHRPIPFLRSGGGQYPVA
jgi:hypothetical protein